MPVMKPRDGETQVITLITLITLASFFLKKGRARPFLAA